MCGREPLSHTAGLRCGRPAVNRDTPIRCDAEILPEPDGNGQTSAWPGHSSPHGGPAVPAERVTLPRLPSSGPRGSRLPLWASIPSPVG